MTGNSTGASASAKPEMDEADREAEALKKKLRLEEGKVRKEAEAKIAAEKKVSKYALYHSMA